MFEFTACFEFWVVSSRNRDGLASLGIATFAGFAFGFGECAETNEFHVIAFFHAVFHGFQGGVSRFFPLGLLLALVVFATASINSALFILKPPKRLKIIKNTAVSMKSRPDVELRGQEFFSSSSGPVFPSAEGLSSLRPSFWSESFE